MGSIEDQLRTFQEGSAKLREIGAELRAMATSARGDARMGSKVHAAGLRHVAAAAITKAESADRMAGEMDRAIRTIRDLATKINDLDQQL